MSFDFTATQKHRFTQRFFKCTRGQLLFRKAISGGQQNRSKCCSTKSA